MVKGTLGRENATTIKNSVNEEGSQHPRWLTEEASSKEDISAPGYGTEVILILLYCKVNISWWLIKKQLKIIAKAHEILGSV